MKKIKKYIYPIILSAIFIILYLTLLTILNTVLEKGNYAGAALAVLFAGSWALFVVPVYCVKFGKVICKERFKYLFVTYNCLVLSFLHLMFFNFDSDTYFICVIFLLWTLFWTSSPLISQLISSKQQVNDNVSENS